MPRFPLRAHATACALASACLLSQSAFAGGPLKVGYLDLNKIKQLYPEAAQVETMKQQAELQLVDVVNRANKALIQAQQEKKSPQEISKLHQDMQLQVQGMQQGIKLMVDQQTQATYAKITGAASAVAKDRGLDVVVDSNTIFAGAEPLTKNGEDLTDPVLRKLLVQQPQQPSPTKPPAAN
jgi:Skp family chaperone for outer membrane proteins